MKKRITAVLMSAALLMSAGCAAQTVQNQGSVPDSGAQEKTQSTAQKETSAFEQPAPAPEVPEETVTGTVMGEEAFLAADEWELPMGSAYVRSKDGDINKNFVKSFVPLNQQNNAARAERDYFNKYDGSASYDSLIYSYYLAIGAAKPDMRKISAHELAEILSSFEFSDDIMESIADDDFEWDKDGFSDSAADSERSRKVYDAVQKIQYFPDGIFTGLYMNSIVPQYLVPTYYYWPESSELSERRTALRLNLSTMELSRYSYDEYGDLESSECLYSYPYELEKAAREKYGFSDKRESARLNNPYIKTVFKDPALPQPDKKLVGKEVVYSGSSEKSVKYRYNYCMYLDEKAQSLGFGDGKFEYQYNLALGKAYPNMRKITLDEIVKLFDDIKIYKDVDYSDISVCEKTTNDVINEIKKIQYFADGSFPEYHDSVWLYWPDADTIEERRTEIQIFSSQCTVRLAKYDETGKRISLEDIFSLEEKVKQVDLEGAREEYPTKRRITEEEVRSIMAKAESAADSLDISQDSLIKYGTDKDFCREFMEPYIKEIEKIQPIPDSFDSDRNIYTYYLDANNIKDRRFQIEVLADEAWVVFRKFRSDGTEKYYENIFHLSEYMMHRKIDRNHSEEG